MVNTLMISDHITVITLFVSIYFAPSIAAYLRDKYFLTSIVRQNLLYGWTGIGWILAWKRTLRPDPAYLTRYQAYRKNAYRSSMKPRR